MEAEANRFSSDLLLPPYLVVPKIVRREPCIDLVSDIGKSLIQASQPPPFV
ncbi:hypothetical protein SAMN05216387_1202 [Nitrosovibrio tenuis]|uniref:Uncharacterized protein n=1 Tax=Nitrosovibrio tenuis TaxID=1233 RepID=A0A1H7RUQ0_9PROT|nr:hypothetical protein SAMN05216387_1202 [Nitrosovibrio tenuis]